VKKKILLGIGVFVVLIVIWRVNAMINTPEPAGAVGGVYDVETKKFYHPKELRKKNKKE